MRKPLLIEIGVEELPHSHVKGAIETLRKTIPLALGKLRIGFEDLHIWGTPRRLVIYVKEIDMRQSEEEAQIVGPSKEVAFDSHGKPTQAYWGFLRSHDANEKSVKFQQVPNKKGEYLVIEKCKPGQRVRELLPQIIQEQMKQLPFSRKMHWDSSLFFSRPIRWVVVLLGNQAIPVCIGQLRSGRVTYGHRTLHPQPATLNTIEDYFRKMRQWKILLDPAERQRSIQNKLRQENHFFKEGHYQDLIEEVANLVEIPHFLKGTWSKRFLELPEEVLTASMAKYQRIFALRDETGKLTTSFLAVLNGKPSELNRVKKHYEWVLNARLADSLFFFEEDQKVPKGDGEILSSKLNALQEVNFHEGLGSLYDKSFRLETLCRKIAEDLQWSRDKMRCVSVTLAAIYSKCDLLTKMVYEFPSLQGVIGHRYALLDKVFQERLYREAPLTKELISEMAQAIEEQYYPKGAGQAIPQTDQGAILAIADRLDTLTGFFGIGIYPTGSEDPMGLRRASTGIIRILLEKRLVLSIDKLIERSISSYQESRNSPSLGNLAKLKEKILDFLKERLVIQLRERYQSSDLIDAVMSSKVSTTDVNGVKIDACLNQLEKIMNEPYFYQAAKVQERTQNIVKSSKGTVVPEQVNVQLLQEEPEKKLWHIYQTCREEIKSFISSEEYQEATRVYGGAFFSPLHEFFEKVLVNVEKSELRDNRLSLCNRIYNLYADSVADLSRLSLEKGNK